MSCLRVFCATLALVLSSLPLSANPAAAKSQTGIASWYDCKQPGECSSHKITASGERFNPNAMTAAHRTLPLGSRVRVTHRLSGRSVVVRINDRGPFVGGRILDLSRAAARKLGVAGLAQVHIQLL